MLANADLLVGIAEIAIAFAGFASLSSVFARRAGRDDTHVDVGRLMNMLTASLAVTGLALLPVVHLLYGVGERWVWSGSAGLGLIAIAAQCPGTARRTREMRQYAGFNNGRSYLNYAFLCIAICALLCTALNAIPAAASALYFTGLAALLVVSGSLFFSVIESLARSSLH